MHHRQQSSPILSLCVHTYTCMRCTCMRSQSNNNNIPSSHVPVINERFHSSIHPFASIPSLSAATDTNTPSSDTIQDSTLHLPLPLFHPTSPTPPTPTKLNNPSYRIHLLAARVSLTTTSPCAPTKSRQRRKTSATCHSASDRATCIRAIPTQGTHHPIPATAPITDPADTAEM